MKHMSFNHLTLSTYFASSHTIYILVFVILFYMLRFCTPYLSDLSLLITARLCVLQDTSLTKVNSAIVVKSIGGVCNSPVTETSIVVVTQCVRSILAGDKLVQSTHTISAALAGTSSQSVQRQDTIVEAHADEFVSCVGGTVAVLLGVILDALFADGSGVGARAANDFSGEVAAERSHLGENEVTVRVRGELSKAGRVAEVIQRHGCEDTNDDIVVAEVGVKGTIQREVGRVIGDAAVDGAVGDGDVLVCQASEKFLDIADALSSAGRVAISVVIVVRHIKGIFKTGPFICGEEVTEV